MPYEPYDPKKSNDNWDDQPKNDGGSGNNYYRQYTPPTGNGIFPDHMGQQPPRDQDGSTSKTLGFVGLFVTLCFCDLAGIILGIIGLSKARSSARILGFESSDAATGRVLGIVNIVLGCLRLLVSIGYIIFLVVTGTFSAMLAGEGIEALTFVG
ncbi:MAG: hypothetical protein J5958_06060 [Clostridia bacterium]|nr:hypothetical protein [Clostridia bacterium]